MPLHFHCAATPLTGLETTLIEYSITASKVNTDSTIARFEKAGVTEEALAV
ncbi:MAG TPA: hypothetical protein VMW37_05285 [Dehalococcoidales bacterium]|nr:hypothetical protein [Dehalococcoidales bacterium]